MIKFAGLDMPDYIKITNVKYSILPSIEAKTEKIYGRAGSYDFGIELGEKVIEADFLIIADNQNDIIRKARDLTTYLFYKDLQPLILSDEPDKQYMARVVGDTEITELYRTGRATIKFLCPSPYAESLEEISVSASPVDETPINLQNNGSTETYPVIEMTMKESSHSIAVISNDKYILIGQSPEAEKSSLTIDPIVLSDNMDSYSGWSTASAIDGGAIAGTFSSNGQAVSVTGKDYGDGATIGQKWHGASAIKALPRELDNFTVSANVGFDASLNSQVGRIEIYLLDANNAHIGKFALVDSTSANAHPRFEARAGALSVGKYFINDYGNYKGVFENFYGMIKIWKHGNKWGAYIGKIDQKGNHHTRLAREYIDHQNLFSSKKLAKIQIHIGTFYTYQPVNNMYISHLSIYEKTMSIGENQNPVLFRSGDTVTIDNQKAIVLRNGEPVFHELDPSSDFFGLDRGANGIIVSPPVADVTVRYKERWL